MHWLRGLTVLLLSFFYKNELLALFLILLVEEAGVPMPPPGYTLLILAGARPGRSILSALLVVGVASLAAFAGSYTSFYLTRRFGRERLIRYARFLRVKESRIEQMQRWTERHGRLGIFAGRLIPGLRTPTIFVAGLAGMRLRTFAVIDAIAAVLWAAAYYGVGALIEPQRRLIWRFAVRSMDDPWRVALVASLSLAAVLGVRLWLKRQRSTMEAKSRRGTALVGAAVDALEARRAALTKPLATDTDPAGV